MTGAANELNMNLLENGGGDEELGASTVAASDVNTPGARTNIIKGFPGSDSPLIFKIIPQKRASGKMEGYWAITKHTHLVGDRDPKNKKNYRSHLCQKSSGQQDCPECDKYYDLKSQLNDLEKQGKKGTAEFLRLEAQAKAVEPSQKGWLLVVLPENPEVKAIQVGKDVLNKLFGKPATKWKPAVESLINKMAADGNDPYNLRSNTGWIKGYKEGEGRDTVYTLAAATMTTQAVVNGKQMNVNVPLEAMVHDNIFKTKRSDLPNLGKFEERSIWKKEWSKYMADNFHAPAEALATESGPSEEDDNPLAGGNAAPDIPVASSLPTMPPAAAPAQAAPVAAPTTAAPQIDDML